MKHDRETCKKQLVFLYSNLSTFSQKRPSLLVPKLSKTFFEECERLKMSVFNQENLCAKPGQSGWPLSVGNKVKGQISKRVFQGNKARQIFRKRDTFYPDTHTYVFWLDRLTKKVNANGDPQPKGGKLLLTLSVSTPGRKDKITLNFILIKLSKMHGEGRIEMFTWLLQVFLAHVPWNIYFMNFNRLQANTSGTKVLIAIVPLQL